MKRRSLNLLSQIHKKIGSATHWMFRILVSFLSDKLGIDLPPWLERNIAYVCAGLFLALIGVWHYLPWLPGIDFSSFDIDAITVLTIVGVVISYLAWRSAHEAARYTKEAVDDSRAARLNLRDTPVFGGFTIANIGKDMAKNIYEVTAHFNSVPRELLASMGFPPASPLQATNRSAVAIISLVKSIDPAREIVVVFQYENSFGNKFVSEFTITNPQKPLEGKSYAPHKVSEKKWTSC